MDYKEKYEAALERAKELIAKWVGKNKDFYLEDYSYIFPELKESEDKMIDIPFGAKDSELIGFEYKIPDGYYGIIENGVFKIKKVESEDERIIRIIRKVVIAANNGDMPVLGSKETEQVLAWLEKQITAAVIPDELVKCYKDFCEKGSKEMACLISAINFVNQQKEQKPEIPLMDGDADLYFDNWFQHKGQVSSRQCFEEGMRYAKRLQKPAEWSEEDEKMRCNILNALIPNLVYSFGKGTSTGTSTYKYDKEIAWLKSLRPQPRWKPSEKQMDALANATMIEMSENHEKALESLYEDLTKL